jgi:hypothetical protein
VAISYRQADLEADYREFVDTLQANLPHLPHALFFDWLYRRNPEGSAVAWVAIDSAIGKMIGIASAFPRSVYSSGKVEKGYVLGDFCVAAQYRSLGLALTLQRACLAGLSGSMARFVLDFPSDGMLAVYRRLRIGTGATMIRHAKPLRADRKIAEKAGAGSVARALTAVVNTGLLASDVLTRRRTVWKIAGEAGPWGEEFTRAAIDWSPAAGTCVARTADYLNWRYGGHPQRRYEILTARGDGKLHGYLVQHMDGVDCTIDDLMAEDDDVRKDLLMESIAAARTRGVQTISAPWLASHPGTEMLRKSGFRPRESHRVILMSWPGSPIETGQHDGWYISHGDWER